MIELAPDQRLHAAPAVRADRPRDHVGRVVVRGAAHVDPAVRSAGDVEHELQARKRSTNFCPLGPAQSRAYV
jgi:hypothetical protein